MSGNSVTGAIVRNKVVFDIDNKSYQKVLTRVRSLQAKITKSVSAARGGLATKTGKTFGSQPHIIVYQKQMQLMEKAHARALALNKAFNLKQANAVQQQGKLHVKAIKYDSQRTDKLQNDIQRRGLLHSKALRMNEQFDNKIKAVRGIADLKNDRVELKSAKTRELLSSLRLETAQRRALQQETAKLGQAYKANAINLQQYNAKYARHVQIARSQSKINLQKSAGFSPNPISMGMNRAGMGSGIGMVGGAAGVAAVAGAAIAASIGQIRSSARDLVRSENVITAVFGEQKADDELAYVKQQANKLGISLSGAVKDYSDLALSAKAIGFDQKEQRKLFESTAQYGTVMGLDPAQQGFMNKALVQTMSKGRVQLEEVTGQLAEFLPNSVNSIAEKLNLKSSEFLSKISKNEIKVDAYIRAVMGVLNDRSLPALHKTLTSSYVAAERFSNTLQDQSRKVMANGLDKSLNGLYSSLNHWITITGSNGIAGLLSGSVNALTKGIDVAGDTALEFSYSLQRAKEENSKALSFIGSKFTWLGDLIDGITGSLSSMLGWLKSKGYASDAPKYKPVREGYTSSYAGGERYNSGTLTTPKPNLVLPSAPQVTVPTFRSTDFMANNIRSSNYGNRSPITVNVPAAVPASISIINKLDGASIDSRIDQKIEHQQNQEIIAFAND